jgi:hypothetical protein
VLSAAQQQRVAALRKTTGATRHTEEPDGDLLYVSLYRDGRFVAEHSVDEAGGCCAGLCETAAADAA